MREELLFTPADQLDLILGFAMVFILGALFATGGLLIHRIRADRRERRELDALERRIRR